MASSFVIVDDRDPSILYSQPWRTRDLNGNPLGQPLEFNTTSTNPGDVGDSAIFTFSGTSVSVYGTVSGGKGASMIFTLDGVLGSPFDPPASGLGVFHQQLFSSQPLQPGVHTLSITAVRDDEDIIFLDYILYETTEVSGKTVFVDDNDSSGVVQFSQGWQLDNDDDSNVQQTAHTSSQQGSIVTLSFSGSTFSMHGSVSDQTANVSVVIDDNTPISATPGTTGANSLLFSSPALHETQHTAKITLLNDAKLAVDYFLVTPAADGAVPPNSESTKAGANSSANSINITPTPTTVASIFGPSGTADLPPTPTTVASSFGPSGTADIPPSASSDGGNAPTAIANPDSTPRIVGGTLGALLLLCIFCITRMVHVRKRRRTLSWSREIDPILPLWTSPATVSTRHGGEKSSRPVLERTADLAENAVPEISPPSRRSTRGNRSPTSPTPPPSYCSG